MLESVVKWARVKSPWILHFNTGACNACDIEVLAALTPRSADVMVVTGSVTRQVKNRLVRVYEQMPEPKFVLVIGNCATSGGVFQKCYSVYEGVDKVIPVNMYVPGCPPKPEAIIYGVAKLLEKISKG